MQLDNSLVSCIRFQQSLRPDMDTGILKQPEIMFFPVGKSQADNLAVLEIYQHLGFQRMPFFLSRIVPSLLF